MWFRLTWLDWSTKDHPRNVQGFEAQTNCLYCENSARTYHIWWSNYSSRFTESTDNRYCFQSSTDLGTQANSPSTFPLTGSPSQCMENVESFWWADNPSRQSSPEAWKIQNRSNDFSTSRPTCISPKYPPFSPLWSHKCTLRSHEDFRKSTLPFLLARLQTRRWSVCFQLLCLSETQQSHEEAYS